MILMLFFFFNDTATTEIYTNLNTRSLHDALPILVKFILQNYSMVKKSKRGPAKVRSEEHTSELQSHSDISYAVFCLKKKQLKANYGIFTYVQLIDTFDDTFVSIYLNYLNRANLPSIYVVFFFFNDTATTVMYTNLNTLSLHDALPISVTSSLYSARTVSPAPAKARESP